MTILVTGGGGYIGSHMAHALVDAGEPVVVVDNLSTGFRSALPKSATLVVGDVGDQAVLTSLIKTHAVTEIIHFAASIVVPDSVRDPLGYYRNNTMNTRALLEVAVTTGVQHFIFSSTAAVYGNPQRVPVAEDAPLAPMSPYGNSKLMTRDHAQGCRGGARPQLRDPALLQCRRRRSDSNAPGKSTVGATHLIKVAVETALGLRPQIEVFGTDYDTPDGTCVRDYIHVNDLVRAHFDALAHLRRGGASDTFNCGYGHGYSVLDVIERGEARERARLRGAAFGAPARRSGVDRGGRERASARSSTGRRNSTISTRSWRMRSPGSASSPRCAQAPVHSANPSKEVWRQTAAASWPGIARRRRA